MARPVPPALAVAMANGRWPRASVASSALGTMSRFEGMWLELLQPENIESVHEGCVTALFLMGGLHERDGRWQVCRTDDSPVPLDLPWVDLDQALVVAVGADHGDDTWVLLDMRSSPTQPRVLYNVLLDRWGERMTWVGLAPTLDAFLGMVEPAPRRPLQIEPDERA